MNIRDILVVDDHRLIYEGLKHALPQFRLNHASSIREARQLVSERPFYAHILDISLGSDNGFDLARDLIASGKDTLVFFLSMHDTPLYIKTAQDLGARGYFLKDEDLSLITRALESPHESAFWIDRRGKELLEKHSGHEETRYELLTQREQQVFRMLAEGMNYKEIAARLDISSKTVNVHRAQLMAKLCMTSQNELFRLALKLEIIRL